MDNVKKSQQGLQDLVLTFSSANRRLIKGRIKSVDYTHWAKMASWSKDQAMILICGLDPRHLDRTTFKKISSEEEAWATFRDWSELVDNNWQVILNIGNCNSPAARTKPHALCSWAIELEIGSDEFLEFANSQISSITIEATLQGAATKIPSSYNAEIHPKKLTSLLTLVHALAASKPLRYDPQATDNGAVQRIYNAVQEAELSLSERTIRKYLKEANTEAIRLREKNQ